MEEEVAAVEVDEVDHRGPVKIGGVLWVVSHNIFDEISVSEGPATFLSKVNIDLCCL